MKVHMLYLDLELKGVYADKKIAQGKLEKAKKSKEKQTGESVILEHFNEDNWIDTHTVREK